MNQYLSDIYIMIPCHSEKSYSAIPVQDAASDINAREFLKLLSDTSEYECSNDVPKQLQRLFLGRFYFACSDDDYEAIQPEVLPESRVLSALPCSVFLTVHPDTGLSVLFLALLKSEYDYTFIADQISTEYLYIRRKEDEKFCLLSSFIQAQFHLTALDVPRALFTLPKKPEPAKRLESLLAGEAYESRHVSYKLQSASITKAASENIAEFDFYESYVSSRFLLYILKDFSENPLENLEDEAAMLFICELILFQNGAIARTNQKIIRELTSPKKISLKTIEEMNTEFGKTIRFWNKGNFQYSLVQELSNKISAAFGTPELLEDYHKNQEHLEHIVDLKGSQSSEREGKIINFLAIFLAVIQIIPLVVEWGGYLLNSPEMLRTVQTLGTVAGVLFIFVLAWFIRRKGKLRRSR